MVSTHFSNLSKVEKKDLSLLALGGDSWGSGLRGARFAKLSVCALRVIGLASSEANDRTGCLVPPMDDRAALFRGLAFCTIIGCVAGFLWAFRSAVTPPNKKEHSCGLLVYRFGSR